MLDAAGLCPAASAFRMAKKAHRTGRGWTIPWIVGNEGAQRSDPAVRVLIVDDSEPFRSVLREVVEATPGMAHVGEAASGEAALEAADRLGPQLVIIDKRMPGIGGLETARRIRSRHPGAVVVLASAETPRSDALDAAAAHAFVHKRELTPRTLTELWRTHGA
jgi:two-component system invasion response regulator UvrY